MKGLHIAHSQFASKFYGLANQVPDEGAGVGEGIKTGKDLLLNNHRMTKFESGL